MEDIKTMLSVQDFVEAKHRSSVLSAVFGLDFAVKHALSHALCMWAVERHAFFNSCVDLESFIRASYHDLAEPNYTPGGLPVNSIPFFAWGTFTLDAYTFQAHSASWWYLLDMVAPDPSRIIPSTLFIPYASTSAVRSDNAVKGFERTPLWFICHDGSLGVPVDVEDDRPFLWHGEKDFRRSDGTWRKTTKIKISWPGYDDGWEKQIRLESDTGDRSIGRLAGLVAHKVCDFIRNHDPNVKYLLGTSFYSA
ncbi:hypothetical protein PENSPDRAFT_752367 [Peniophora sp. CONT]|nr:hypothetical protein PENSPDRAFT_752367 [Peniophora sp. CONT]